MGSALFEPKVQLDRMLLTGLLSFQNTESKEMNGIRDESTTFESKGKYHHFNYVYNIEVTAFKFFYYKN